MAGKGAGEAGEYNGWPAFIAAVAKVKPRQFLAENVPGMMSQKHRPYLDRIIAELTGLGYRVKFKKLDAVAFGAPQFRKRIYVWGIRNDVPAKHCWPVLTHAWPWPGNVMFPLLPAITVGQALNIPHVQCDGTWWMPTGEPFGEPFGEIHKRRAKSVERRNHPISEPMPTLDAGSARHYHAYRWSDAMLQKHPPTSPASPASPVMAKFSKGGAEGLIAITDNTQHQPHQPHQPAPTVRARSPREGGRCTENVIREKLMVRRLLVAECASLQTLPDDFIWPASVPKTARYRIIGNGWVAIMGHVFAQAFAAADPVSETVIDLFCGGGCGAVGWHGNFWQFEAKETQ